MKHEIRTYGDPVLREKAQAIASVDDEIRRLAADMIETMRAHDGVGLAAQQVGQARAICVIGMPDDYDLDEKGVRMNPDLAMPLVLINPQITDPSADTDSREEGCLSFPDIRANITRPLEISVSYLDESGSPKSIHPKGFLARVIQHEVDHLNGVLFIDRMSAAKRFAVKGRIRKLKQETEERMGRE